MIKNTLPNKSENPKSLKSYGKGYWLMFTMLARIYWGLSKVVFLFGFVFEGISEKILCSKDFTRNFRETFIRKQS